MSGFWLTRDHVKVQWFERETDALNNMNVRKLGDWTANRFHWWEVVPGGPQSEESE
jgi:hypothetical protein